jgi:GntR family transcriptional regulator
MARAESLDGDFSLYRQVETILRGEIADGVLRAGDRLPAEDSLRAEYGVSRGTLRQALDALERDGLIDRTRGRGTFVRAGTTGETERSLKPLEAMIADAATADRLTRTGSVVPPAVASAALGLSARHETPFFIRLSERRGAAAIGVKRYLAPALSERLDDLAQAADFPGALAQSGVHTRGRAWVEAILAEPRFAMQLKVPLGAPLLSLWWVDLVGGTPAACTQMLRVGAAVALDLAAGEE